MQIYWVLESTCTKAAGQIGTLDFQFSLNLFVMGLFCHLTHYLVVHTKHGS